MACFRQVPAIAVLVMAVVGCNVPPAGGGEEAPSSTPNAPAPVAERSLIGRWRDTRPMVAGTIEIARIGDRLVLEQAFDLDGSVLRVDLTEGAAEQGRRFEAVEGAAAGMHWVVTPDGSLEIRDSLGLVATLQGE